MRSVVSYATRAMTREELIAGNRYMVLSTADATGRPWASPVWFAPDGKEAFLWISRPDTRHSLYRAAAAEMWMLEDERDRRIPAV